MDKEWMLFCAVRNAIDKALHEVRGACQVSVTHTDRYDAVAAHLALAEIELRRLSGEMSDD